MFGQSSKPLAVFFPAKINGNVSDSRKQMLLQTLHAELSNFFDVSSPDKYVSHDLPVVSNVFQLQVTKKEDGTRLNLKWLSKNDNRDETSICVECSSKKLNKELISLINNLVVGSRNEQDVQYKTKRKGVLYGHLVKGNWEWFDYSFNELDRKYEGEIKDGKPDGHGKGISSWGTYVGSWLNGKKHGHGTKTYLSGDKYIGQWKNGEKHGQGTYISTGGEIYEGQWKQGRKDGLGTETFADGGYLEAEWKNGELNGQAAFTWSDGEKLTGEFRVGKFYGHGTLTLPDGRKRIGDFKASRPWNITEFDKYGNIISRWVEGQIRKN